MAARQSSPVLRGWHLTEKKGGKTTITGRIVYSADGKTRTLTSSVPNANGTKTKATSVYDKQ